MLGAAMSATHRFGNLLVVLVVSAGALLLTAQAQADEGITVTSVGKATTRPTQVEITGTVSGDAELASDAMVKYRDAKRRAVSAIEGLKIAQLSVESNGATVTTPIDQNAQMMAMRGMPAGAAVKQRVMVSEPIKLILKGVDKMDDKALMDTVLKIIDTSKDSGLAIGTSPQGLSYYQMQQMAGQGTPMLVFRLADPAQAREQAFKSAVDDAKQKAQHLADLAGVKLGRIISLSEQAQASKESDRNMTRIMAIYGMSPDEPEAEFTSAGLSEIPVTVRLTVQFEIAK